MLLWGGGAALLVDVPSVGLVAAADDAELAGDIVLFGVRWDDREPIDMALECHGSALQHVRQAAINELINAFGVDVALGIDPQLILGKVLGRVTPDFLAAVFAIEARIVAGAVQGLVRGIVTERKSLMRADRRKADDVTVRPDPARNLTTKLQRTPGASASG